MVYYKNLLDPAKYLGPADFTPEGREVTIARLAREDLPSREGDKEKQAAPMLYVQAKDGSEYVRPLKIPKSVLHGLSLLLGTETDAWIGKKIHLFRAACMSFGEREDCVRVRFPADVDRKVRTWMKKRKASASAYMLEESKA